MPNGPFEAAMMKHLKGHPSEAASLKQYQQPPVQRYSPVVSPLLFLPVQDTMNICNEESMEDGEIEESDDQEILSTLNLFSHQQ